MLRVTFRGNQPAINVAAGTTRYGGGGPVSPDALWQIGSNTKAFTAVMLLQLEADGKLSIDNTVGKWLPQYPAWRTITIRQLLDMTSGIPDYEGQPAFDSGEAAGTGFSAARLVGYVAGEVTGDVWNYSNTNYILAQMIIQKVTHDSYADQLTCSRTLRMSMVASLRVATAGLKNPARRWPGGVRVDAVAAWWSVCRCLLGDGGAG